MKLLKLIKKFLNKIIMALENKKLSAYGDLASSNIDTTTKLVVLTGATKVNANLPVVNFIEDSLMSSSVVRPLSAKQGKALQDTKAPIANPTFTGAVNGVTKAMVGLGDVDNTSDANKPISTLQAAGLAPKANPTFTGNVVVPNADAVNEAVNKGQLDSLGLHVLEVSGDSGPAEGYLNQVVILSGGTRYFDLSLSPVSNNTIVVVKNNNSVNTTIAGATSIDGVNVDPDSGVPVVLAGAYDKIKLIKITSGWLIL